MSDAKISAFSTLGTTTPTDLTVLVSAGQTYNIQIQDLFSQRLISGINITGTSSLSKIVGGSLCSATGFRANTFGGLNNLSNSQYSTILNGLNCTINDNSNRCTILNGNVNTIGNTSASPYAIALGGSLNQINGANATIINSVGSIATGSLSLICSTLNSFAYGTNSTILCGSNQYNAGDFSSILAGNNCSISGIGNSYASYSTICGGSSQQVTANESCALYGNTNSVNSIDSLIGGILNYINPLSISSISLGGAANSIGTGINVNVNSNTNASYSVIFQGTYNTCLGLYGTILNGDFSTISGNYGTAIGNYIQIPSAHSGATVIADNNRQPKYSIGPMSCTFNFQSGVAFSGCDPILHKNFNLPSNSNSNGFIGSIKMSGHNLLICTGINQWGKIIITSY